MNKKKQPNQQPSSPLPPIVGMRLNKFLAHSGLCSRRQAVEYIKAGKVQVNGVVVLEPWYQIQAADAVTYKGKPISPEDKQVYILMNKPKNVITTVKDERGRKTVIDIIKNQVSERVFPVGRLDRATVGLLLLTNDGDLAQKLAHPSHGVKKFYHVILDQPVAAEHIQQIRSGITLEDGAVQVDAVNYIKNAGKEEVGIEIHIGRNRIVRRIFEHFGYKVVKLDRTYYAGLTKKDLPRGRFRHLTKQEVIRLKHFV